MADIFVPEEDQVCVNCEHWSDNDYCIENHCPNFSKEYEDEDNAFTPEDDYIRNVLASCENCQFSGQYHEHCQYCSRYEREDHWEPDGEIIL